MDKTAIKNFAIEARKILIKSAITEAGFYGITNEECKLPVQKGNDFEVYETLAGTENRIFGDDIKKRANLVEAIKEQSFDQVIEETAYTWFNRIIAIRFMEVNNYLPSRVRVLSSEAGSGTPDIVTQADTVELNLSQDELNRIQQAKNENKYDEAFRLLFIKQCNELNEILPGLFEKTNDYMELLLKLPYTSDGVIRMLVDTIPEDNFNVETEGQVEIIGWMYQFYNSQPKEIVDAYVKKGQKVKKVDLPAKTQIFTPDWIVRYMVENSLGRVWMEHLKSVEPTLNEAEKAIEFGWNYYLLEDIQEEAVIANLVDVRKEYRYLSPQDIVCIDPCMGSGHILVYMFDVLMDIYRSEGFNEREAVFDILEKNIKGLDIDRRAYQLSYFALMMKARGYNRIFFRGHENLDGERVQAMPQVYSLEESNSINRNQLNYFGSTLSEIEKNDAINELSGLLDELIEAKEYGSLLSPEKYNWDLLLRFVSDYSFDGQMDFSMIGIDDTQRKLLHLISQTRLLCEKYHAYITNPPYLGNGMLSDSLSEFIKANYPNEKTDLYSCFIKKGSDSVKSTGFSSLVTMQSWMSLSSFEKMRTDIINNKRIIALMHMDNMVMGIAFGTAVSIINPTKIVGYKGSYNQVNLKDIKDGKPKEFPVTENFNGSIAQDRFLEIAGNPIAYWVSDTLLKAFAKSQLKEIATPRQGLATGDNNRFLRLWFEVDFEKIGFGMDSREAAEQSKKKWFPCNKGGKYKKWFGNNDYVVNWENDGYEIRHIVGDNGKIKSRPQNMEYYFRQGITWSTLTNGDLSMRYSPKGNMFETKGSVCFEQKEGYLLYALGLLNSKVAGSLIEILTGTADFHEGPIGKIPVIVDDSVKQEVTDLVKENIELVKSEYDEDETSYNFSVNPIVNVASGNDLLCKLVTEYIEKNKGRRETLRANEERLNEIFINMYELNSELDKEVSDTSISIDIPDEKKIIKELISYVLGCVLGRFSYEQGGLVKNVEEYKKSGNVDKWFDEDNIVPITDEKYLEDDVVEKISCFIQSVFGQVNFEKNIRYIADVLSESNDNPDITIRNYMLKEFFADHCDMYSIVGSGKRPIYWMFNSGDNNGFKCLVYMHRYTQDTVGLIRSDYLSKVQSAIENSLKNAEFDISNASGSVDKASATRRREKYIKQMSEIKTYYQAIAHIAIQRIAIDLDDGVKTNYAKFQGIEVSGEGTKKQTIDLLMKI